VNLFSFVRTEAYMPCGRSARRPNSRTRRV